MVEVGAGPLGRGVFATQSIQPGQAVLLFTGPVLDHREIAALGDHPGYPLQIGPDAYLDTLPPARYANHSCDPNAGIVNDRVLIALRSIAAGEEVRFDYSTAMSRDHWTTECRCGAPEYATYRAN
jgi:SET domain-containing protein